MDAVLADLRYALRTLARSPGFTAVAVLTLALGIGATTSVYSVVQAVLLRSLPFPRADRLVDIKLTRQEYRAQGSTGGTSPFDAYRVWRTARSFDATAAYIGDDAVLTGLGSAERVMAWDVTASFFPLLGARPLLGRAFMPEDDRPGSSPVAVLGHDFWMSRFGGDPQVLGRGITLDTTSYTIVGVMPAGFHYPPGASLWRDLGAALSGPAGQRHAHDFGFWVVGRLRTDATLAGARTDLDQVTRHAWSSEPGLSGLLPVATPLVGWLTRDVRTPLWIMLGAVGLVLLVACANVSNLLLARATAREREMAVRVALGAGRRRLLRHALAESVVVALAGGALGVLLALWSVPALVALAGSDLPRITEVRVDVAVLTVALGLSLFAGLFAGLLPALRVGLRPPADALKSATIGAGPAWRSRSTDALMIAQVALTLVLLAGAGLLVRSFVRQVHIDPGFDATHVVTAELRLPGARYAAAGARHVWVTQALERVRALPGVTLVAAATGTPLRGGEVSSVSVAGAPGRSDQPWAWVTAADPEYFHVLRIPLLRGGRLGERDGVLVDEAAAHAYFPGADPLGRTIRFAGSAPRTIVGIVGDTRQESLHDAPPPHIYQLLGHSPPPYLKVIVRTAGDPDRLVADVRRAVQSVDVDVPLDAVVPLTTLMADSLTRDRLYAWLVGVFAAAALALAATGMYGLSSHAVTRRTREIGLRMALGASRRAVLGLVVARGVLLTASGVVFGFAGALASTRVLRSYLFQVAPGDPGVLLVAATVLMGVTLAATWLPARRAAQVDPMVALRYE